MRRARKNLGLSGFVAIGGRSPEGQALLAAAKALRAEAAVVQKGPSLAALHRATVR